MKSKYLFLFLTFITTLDLHAFQQEKLKQSIQQLIDQSIEKDSTIPGILIHIESPESDFSFSIATGVNDIESQSPLPSNATARVASNTKTYVAVSILRLWEMDKLNFDDPISSHISEKHADILKSDGYEVDKITIRHLLTHTSGLFDHAASNTYIQKVFSDPQYSWSRTEQIQGCVDWGDPLFKPGEQFSYSDTGYILLGEVIERITGKSLGKAVRELIDYKKLGLTATWWEDIEQKPNSAPERTHQYFRNIDTYSFNPSLDLYGGGGLVSNTKDMAVFYQKLFNNEVFEAHTTLNTMLIQTKFPDNYKPSSDYRMGIFYSNDSGTEMYSHTGFWSTQAAYVPKMNTSVSIIITQFGKGRLMNKLLKETIDLLEDQN